MDNKELVDEFLALLKIPSPSGSELDMANHIMSRIRAMNIDVHMDDANAGTHYDSGNVIAHISGEGPAIMFLAHMDTVEAGSEAGTPIIENGTIKSDGKTILGVDNKSGVASLLGAMDEMVRMPERPNIICAFTICEETSMLGAKAIDLDDKIRFAFDVDGGTTPGTFVNKALGSRRFEVNFFGAESHASRAPEKGKHALRAASLLVANLNMGKRSNGSILNVGIIRGGRSTSVIPGEASVIGELHGYSLRSMETIVDEIKAASKKACELTGCKHELLFPEDADVPPFETPQDEKILKLANVASKAAGLKFERLTLDACVQANIIATRASFPVLELCRGGGGAHSVDEWTTEKYLLDAKNLIVEIAKNARSFVH